jgi:hypothetical protein
MEAQKSICDKSMCLEVGKKVKIEAVTTELA